MNPTIRPSLPVFKSITIPKISIPEISISRAKVQKIAFVFFASICLLSAKFLFSLGGLGTLLSLPAFLLTLTFAIRFFEVKDYDDPEKLRTYRLEASKQPFEVVLQNHGLYNMLKYEILPLSTAFTTKLSHYIDGLSPTLLAKLYLQLVKVAQELGLSMENFREIFVRSLNLPTRRPLSTLFEREDMPLLIQKTKLLHEEVAASYQQYCSCKKEREESQNLAQKCYRAKCLKAIQDLEATIPQAASSQEQRQVASLLSDLAYLKENPLTNDPHTLPIWSSDSLPGLKSFKEQHKVLKKELQEKEDQLRVEFERKVQAINCKFQAT